MTAIELDKKDSGMPKFKKGGFHCPHCGVWAHQRWSGNGYFPFDNALGRSNEYFSTHMSLCDKCQKGCLWVNKKLALPDVGGAPHPHADMPESIKEDYAEAASIVQKSPRAAAALLRLTLEKLCTELGAKGDNLHDKIGFLMKEKGLPRILIESMDTVRIFGNEAVHTGNINLQEDDDIAPALFMLINFIVDKLITEPKAIKAITDRVPQSKRRKDLPPEDGAAS